MEILETINYRGIEIDIHPDHDAPNPRIDHDNFSTMVCFHGGYYLGDNDHGYNRADYNSWRELRGAIESKEKPLVLLPLYLYDHSGISIKIGSWHGKAQHAEWDSGQVGFIFVTEKQMIDAGLTRDYINSNDYWKGYSFEQAAEKVARQDVKVYDQYIQGSVYGYSIEFPDGTEDSCWGFFDEYGEWENILDQAKAGIDHYIRSQRQTHFTKLKQWIKARVPQIYRQPLQAV